jgi:tetratricopeptide (TPR) repeat protein
VSPEPAAALEEERDHLLRSIEDLDREHAAGEVGEPDYAELRAGYVARAAAVLRALEEASSPTAGSPQEHHRSGMRRALGRRRVRLALGAVLAICVVGLVLLFALRAAGVRLPGETASGSPSLSSAQQVRQDLQQARQLGSSGDVKDALTLYQQVLAVEPHQPEALAYRGWLLRLTGLQERSTSARRELVDAGRASIEEAVAAEPAYGDAHLFLGLTLLEDARQLQPAVAQFRLALADHASTSLISATRPVLVRAFRSAHAPLPAGLRS